MSGGARVGADELSRFAREVLSAVGMPTQHAVWTAEAMVWADLRGLSAHGVSGKLPQCVGRIRAGGTKAAPRIHTLRDLGAAVSLDAGHAWGQVAGVVAIDLAATRALTHGVGLVTVRHTSSAAAMGYYVWRAARRGCLGAAITNGPALVAAPDGARRVVGNQGHAIGYPDGTDRTVVYDSATTLMSTGAMEAAHERGEQLPPGVLRDRSGRPTRDPGEWVTGLLEPLGGHHGFGLSVGLEALTGLLAGGDRFGSTVGMPGALDERQGVSLCLLAVRVDLAGDRCLFDRHVRAFREQVEDSGVGSARPRLPGDGGRARGHRAAREGVRVQVVQLDRLRRLADELRLRPIRPIEPHAAR